jgi:hypothetical protein
MYPFTTITDTKLFPQTQDNNGISSTISFPESGYDMGKLFQTLIPIPVIRRILQGNKKAGSLLPAF